MSKSDHIFGRFLVFYNFLVGSVETSPTSCKSSWYLLMLQSKNPSKTTSSDQQLRSQMVQRRTQLKKDAKAEAVHSQINRNKVQDSWLSTMRQAKVIELRKLTEVMSQDHEREVERKDAILQMSVF